MCKNHRFAPTQSVVNCHCGSITLLAEISLLYESLLFELTHSGLSALRVIHNRLGPRKSVNFAHSFDCVVAVLSMIQNFSLENHYMVFKVLFALSSNESGN